MPIRDFIYLDAERVHSLATQLGVDSSEAAGRSGDELPRALRERLFNAVEPKLGELGGVNIGPNFDFAQWQPAAFKDGHFVRATGAVRLLDYAFLGTALGALPAVLKKMSRIEMEALKNSEAGRRMSKQALQERSQANQLAIQKVEDFKIGELNESVLKLYGEVVRVKVRPSPSHPAAVLTGPAAVKYFHDSPAALSQKYGVEIDAGWAVVCQLNAPNLQNPPQAIPIGNQMEDAFEQLAMLMNNAFKVANAPAFPNVSITPIAIYREI